MASRLARAPTESLPFDPLEGVRTTTCLTTVADRRRKLNQYRRGVRVGKGKHGEVYLCQDGENNGREVAVKAVKRSNPRDRIKLLRRNHQQPCNPQGPPPLNSTENSIRKEIAIMKKCRHGNHVRLLEVIDDPQQEKIYMAMEYVPGGPVQWFDSEHKPVLTLAQTRRIIRDVIVALEYLHHNGILHRDIKPANLLWTSDRSTVKIIDFGVSHYSPRLARQNSRSKRRQSQEDTVDVTLFPESDLLKRTGTPSFLAPEVVWFPEQNTETSPATSSDTLANSLPSQSSATLQGACAMPAQRPPITTAIDVWSLGVTFYCLLFGHTPFNVPESANENVHHNEYVLYRQICTQDWTVDGCMGADRVATGGRRPKDLISEGCAIVSLLDRILQKNPQNRITLFDLKRHSWFLQDISEPTTWLRNTSPAAAESPTACLLLRRVGKAISGLLNRSSRSNRFSTTPLP